MLRILYVYDDLRIGGKERQLVELLKGLHNHKDIVPAVVSLGTDNYFHSEISKFSQHLFFIRRYYRWDIKVFFHLYKIIIFFRPHIIQSSCTMTTFYSFPFKIFFNILLINNTIRNAFGHRNVKWYLEKFLLLLSDIRLSNSYAGLDSRQLPSSDKRNIVIHNGVALDRFKVSLSQILPKPLGHYFVGMVAQFKDHKDYYTFLKAAEAIIKKRNDVTFYAVGDGTNLKKLQSLYKHLPKNIVFTGRINKVEKLIANFDICVLTTYTEGISNSIIEYMALGKPVITTDCAGTRELVIDKNTGFLIPSEDIEKLVFYIELLLSDASLREKMGSYGRKRIHDDFNLCKMVDQTYKLYSLISPKCE